MDLLTFLPFVLIATTAMWLVIAVTKGATGTAAAAPLCFLGCHPRSAYDLLDTPSDRVLVCIRGLAVIVSPATFTLALFHNRSAVLGSVPYPLLLPIVVFTFDWLIMATSYTQTGRRGWLLAIRSIFICFSLFVALIAALLGERANLAQGIHRQEDARTAASSAWQALEADGKRLDAHIAANTAQLAELPRFQSKAIEARRLEDLECHGASGVDPDSGEKIVGGKCGPRAASHRASAEAAEKQIEQLRQRAAETEALEQARQVVDAKMEALLQAGRSDPSSISTLIAAVLNGAVDLGMMFSLFMTVAMLVLPETFALVISEIPLPETLVAAVQFTREEDAKRLENRHAERVADIAAARRRARATAGIDLPPIELSTPPFAEAAQ